MSDKIETRYHNIEILGDLGYKQISNTVVFKNGRDFILSPAVSESANGKYWFDIREVNLNKVTLNSILLVRIVPDLFVIVKIASLSNLLSKKLMDNRPHSGNVWGIHLEMDKNRNSGYLFNTKEKKHKILVSLIKKDNLSLAFNTTKNSSNK